MLRLILRRIDGVYSTVLVRRPDGWPDGAQVVGVELEHEVTCSRAAEPAPSQTEPDGIKLKAGTNEVAAHELRSANDAFELPYRRVASEVWILIDEQGVPVPSTIGENGQSTIIACSEFEAAQTLREYQKNFDIVCSAVRIR